MIPEPPPKVLTRLRDGRIHAYVVGAGAYGRLEPAAVFQPRDGEEVVASVVRQDLERVVYTTLNGVVCLTRAGDLMWASDRRRPRPLLLRPGVKPAYYGQSDRYAVTISLGRPGDTSGYGLTAFTSATGS